MIVLDTNVVSELARPSPSPTVVDWVDAHDSADLMITALTAAEVRAGVALLPGGRRKREIGPRMEELLTETFAGYVLAFDIDYSTTTQTSSPPAPARVARSAPSTPRSRPSLASTKPVWHPGTPPTSPARA
ncbi:PIN domain-containing protein [Lapillicoccus sp.]|uniref:PIN domain-containing protein n=1 Tax=Lapillicoccus sp. TaxID=1909287 RepID=UPI003982EDD8